MCFNIFYLLFAAFLLKRYSNAQEDQQFFRIDYKYVQPLESFYKIHTTRMKWIDASQACLIEDSNLLLPDSQDEVLEFITVLDYLYGKERSSWMMNGISNVIAEGYNHTLDGIPISELYNTWGIGDSTECPFICKKTLETVEWNQECDLPITGYTYSEDVGRCYKFHVRALNWTDAYTVCKEELSYLAIINSEQEARYLVKLTESIPKAPVTGNYYVGGIAHLGFRKENGVWVTINGVRLEDSGYSNWIDGKPDELLHGGDEVCGSMFYNGKLNDVRCQTRSFFICEHEIDTISSLTS